MNRLVSSLLCTAILCACNGVASPVDPPVFGTPSLKVAASFYPLTFVAERIVGDRAMVMQVVPNGVEPHEYEPTPQQLMDVYDSRILLIGGSGIDPWAEKVEQRWSQEGKFVVVASMGEERLWAEQQDRVSGSAPRRVFDPHVWLDPVRMMTFALGVRDTLIAIDPEGREEYIKNTISLLADLDALDAYFRSVLSFCGLHTIIVSHDAFQYLAKRYGFMAKAIAGVSPEEEPSPKQIAEIIEMAKREKVDVVFFETLVSPKLAEMIAGAAGIRTKVLNPLEGLTPEEIADGDTYLTIMRRNADALSSAMRCRR